MIIVAGIALVVIGPDKFPPFAKAVFKTIRDVKTQFEEAQREIAKEIKPLQKELKELSKHKPEDYIDSLVAGTSSEGDPDFDYEYPYREHETTTKDKTETETETEPDSTEPPEGTETFDATTADSPPVDRVEEDINVEPDGPDWDRYDAEQRAASGDGTD